MNTKPPPNPSETDEPELDEMEKMLIANNDSAGLIEYRKARAGAAQRALDYIEFLKKNPRHVKPGITHKHKDKK